MPLLRLGVIAALALWSLGFLPCAAQAQAGSVLEGRVLDAQTALPLAGASVVLLEHGEAVTDASGNFRFTNLSGGAYRVRISRPGYQPALSDRVTLLAGHVATIAIAMQSAPYAGDLKVISDTSVKASASLEKASTIYRSLNAETLLRAGVQRAGDALRTLPGIVNVDADTAALADDLQLDIRGIGTLETTAALDGHPIAYGVPFGYNYQVSPLVALRAVDVTYGSGSNVFGLSAIGGIVDFETLDPTAEHRLTARQGYGTWDKAATGLQATGTANRFGYAFAYGVSSSDGPLHDAYPFEPGAAFDQSAPPGSAVHRLGIYKQDATGTSRSGLLKLRYDLSSASKITLTAVASSSWNDKTGNGDADYLNYAPALAFGNELLANYSPLNFPQLPACPNGTFVATNANGQPNGFGPDGRPDGGITCQTPRQYATFNTGWDGVGPAWQSFNFDDYSLKYEAAPRNQVIRFDAFTNRYRNTISRQWALPFIAAPGDSPQAFLGDVQVIESGLTAGDTFTGPDNDIGAGVAYLNNAYEEKVISPYFTALGTPIDHQLDYRLHDVYHPRSAPLTAYVDVNFGSSSATNTSSADPRASFVYLLTHDDAIRASAGATTTQPSGDEIGQPFSPSPPGAGGAPPITCSGLNSIGSAPSSLLKPERGVDEELAYAHRFADSSLLQLTAYRVNVYDKLYQTLVPLSQTGTGFIDPAYLAAQTASIVAKCGPGGASLLGLSGTFNVGRLRAQGLMLSGRQYVARRTFIDYDWSLDSTVLVSAPAQLLRANLTLVPGSQLPKLPLHTLNVSLDHLFAHGIDARFTLHAVSANNTKSLPAYDYSDLAVNIPFGPGAFTFAVGNLFNQQAFVQGLRYEGVPLALNQYASAAAYAPYVGAGATERFGLPARALFLHYSVQVH